MQSNITLTDKAHCANCAVDRRGSLVGICTDCNTLRLEGYTVKIKDTIDKDRWSCGCSDSNYGTSHSTGRCLKHSKPSRPAQYIQRGPNALQPAKAPLPVPSRQREQARHGRNVPF
jgi:hypothetical protein